MFKLVTDRDFHRKYKILYLYVCVCVLECMCFILIDFNYRRLDFQCILLACLDLIDNKMADHAC